MSWQAAPTTTAAFAERHAWLSTSPDSGFVKIATAQRRDATGVDGLKGLVLTRNGGDERVLEARDDWFAALADLYGLRVDAEVADRLWSRVKATHDRWVSQQ